jgi:hypothetical protein
VILSDGQNFSLTPQQFDQYHAPVAAAPQLSPKPIPESTERRLGATQYGHSWMRSTILARQSSEQNIDPRHELILYLTSPLEEVADVVRWWGVSILLCIC